MADDRKPTIADIAQIAGVSLMTVSRVINGNIPVRPTTRARVEQAIVQTGYSPDPAARILARGGAGRIGLLYANPSNAYLAEVLSGALSGARESGHHLLLEPSVAGDDPAEVQAVERLTSGGATGLIIPPPLGESRATLEAVAKSGLRPLVLAAPSPGGSISGLKIDDRAAAGEMVKHLVGLGHRIIGFIEGRSDQTASADRRQGAIDAIAACAGSRLTIERGDFTYRSGFLAAERLLAARLRPTALFASNDDMAAGALAAIHAVGLFRPADVSVAGFDDTYVAASVWPALTTIRQPIAEMARAAAIGLSRAPGVPLPALSHQLIVRASTAKPRD